MTLWIEWFRCLHALRQACARRVSFLWLAVVVTTMAIRADLLGVTSFVRAAFLEPFCYPLLLHFFHSSALGLRPLLDCWVRLVLTLFQPVTVGDYLVLVADGLKVAKEGRKMPAVKSLHQESANNSKPEFIMGHSFQALALLVHGIRGQVFAVPLLSRICEGLIWTRTTRHRSLLDKLVVLFQEVTHAMQRRALLVADAYYASHKVIDPLLAGGHHLVTRVRSTSVAYRPVVPPAVRRRGRPRKYGDKVRLRDLFKGWRSFREAQSPVYGEHDVTIQYRCVDLLWRPVGRVVRFVLIKHPTRGNIILLATDLTLDPLTVVSIYGLRFKIEVSFKQALHTLGAYAYHFWMKPMKPISRTSGNQDISRTSDQYKRAVARKMDAYHRYVQLACIAQGLLQHLAINHRTTVWATFRSWLRTMKTDYVPSEMVVAQALRSTFPEFLLNTHAEPELRKFICDRMDPGRVPSFTMVA
jgi:hypothetical protein